MSHSETAKVRKYQLFDVDIKWIKNKVHAANQRCSRISASDFQSCLLLICLQLNLHNIQDTERIRIKCYENKMDYVNGCGFKRRKIVYRSRDAVQYVHAAKLQHQPKLSDSIFGDCFVTLPCFQLGNMSIKYNRTKSICCGHIPHTYVYIRYWMCMECVHNISSFTFE